MDKKEISKNEEIKFKNKKSSLAEFVQRKLPNDKEVAKFEEILKDEAREEEIEEGLSEIYQDDDGNIVDVKKLDIKKKRGIIFFLFSFVFLCFAIGGIGYGIYYYLNSGIQNLDVELQINCKEKLIAGEEVFFDINYKNYNNVVLNQLRIEVDYPDNFIFIESDPAPSQNNSIWLPEDLTAKNFGNIRIKGKIIAEKGNNGIFQVKMNYVPANFSSPFSESASCSSLIEDLGYEFDFSYPNTVLVGDINKMILKIEKQEISYMDDLFFELKIPDNMEISSIVESKDDKKEKGKLIIEKLRDNIWKLGSLSNQNNIEINYKYKEKLSEKEIFDIKFFQYGESGKEYIFYKRDFEISVMKSDLNLFLFINGSENDQSINFNDSLTYTITYTNKGESIMKDVLVMAVLESEFLDWASLFEENNAVEKGNTLTWTKEQIGELEELQPNASGEISFSIKVADFKESDLGKNFEVKSYAQYSIGNEEDFVENLDSKSNLIINKLNSDFSLFEELRYFNEDNIPVGSGPLPPKMNETTSFKVYWQVKNNLHELGSVRVETKLPEYVKWDNKNRTSVGMVYYDSENHQVVWDIGRMPLSVYKADAEFNISITPQSEDFDKILVLLSNTKASATDKETNANIIQEKKTKTTKLEDDEIARENNDGRVQ